MLKKIICLIFGHNTNTLECPVTKVKIVSCLRCKPIKHGNEMSFR